MVGSLSMLLFAPHGSFSCRGAWHDISAEYWVTTTFAPFKQFQM
jgi:hypothetical protein